MLEEIKTEKPSLSRDSIVKIALFIVIFIAIVTVLSAVMNRFMDPDQNPWISNFVNNSSWAYAAYFVYVTIACIIVPLPTLPADIIFLKIGNPVSVILLRLLADIAGSSVNFYVARRYGRDVLVKWFSEKNYRFIENASEHISWQQFFIVAMVPIVNTELLAYAAGISKLRFRDIVGPLFLAVGYRLVFLYLVIKI